MTSNSYFKSDVVGPLASGLCAIHCVATPFLFVVQSCSVSNSCCSSSPLWWSRIDYFFIVVSFFSVYHSSKKTTKSWMPFALYLSWGILTAVIICEKLALLPIAEYWKYIAAFIMISFHLLNLRYCQCAGKGDTVSSSHKPS